VGENLLIALWRDSTCQEREEFIRHLDAAYSLDFLKKSLIRTKEEEGDAAKS
jgi:hypothetical protein